MRLTFPLYLHQFMLINVNIVPTQLFVIVIYVKQMVVSNYVSSTSKPASIKTVCKRIVSCNKPVIFAPIYKPCHNGHTCISKTVCCSVSCKYLNLVKSFVICKTVCCSNVSMAKEFYCQLQFSYLY